MSGRRGPVRRLGLALAVLVLATVGVTACGVPIQGKAQPPSRPNDQVTDVTNADHDPPAPSANNVALYFVDNERLDEINRPVNQIPSDTVAVKQLLSGVTADEKAAGLLSAIPPGTTALKITVEHGVMSLNLSQQFKPTGNTYLQACAQIVFTVTTIPGISGVRFLVEGDPISPPTVDGGNLAVVTRANYRTLAPVAGR